MDESGSKELDVDAWFAARPTLTEERSHPNHWFNRAADLHASAGALWYSMENDGRHGIGEELGFSKDFSMNVACYPVYQQTSEAVRVLAENWPQYYAGGAVECPLVRDGGRPR